MKQKKILIPILVILIAGGMFFVGNQLVNAQTNNPFSGLAAAIASKFNINQNDVQNVINAYQQQHRANVLQTMQQRQKSRLDALVSQGAITSNQETQILNELATLQNQYGPSALQAMTSAQRRQAMIDRRNALTQWANTNGINIQYVLPFGGHRGGWFKAPLSPSPTP